MKYNKITKTEIFVSPVTLGTMTFGSPVAFDEAVRLSRYAYERGINIIDTANMYEGYNRSAGSAGGVAEEIVGKALKELQRDKIIVATKVGMKVGTAPEDDGTSEAAINKQLDKSLKRLDTDYIDIYYLHRSGEAQLLEGTLSALSRAIKSGKIRYYGISNYSGEKLRELLKQADLMKMPRPVICQPPLSLLKQEALNDVMKVCAEENISVTPYQALQGGLLTGKYKRGVAAPPESRQAEKPDWLGNIQDDVYTLLEQYNREAEKLGLTMTEYAIGWALKQKNVVSTMIGVKNQKQIDDAVDGVEKQGL